MVKMIDMIEAMIRGEAPRPPVSQLIGFQVVEAGDGVSRVIMDATEKHHNPMGTVHGGILCDIADAATGIAFASTLDEGESFTSIDFQISFLRPVTKASLTAIGTVIKRGRTIGYVECEIFDESNKLIAKAVSNCIVLKS